MRHRSRSPHQRDESAKASRAQLLGCLRLLERIGIVQRVRRGDEVVVVWRGRPDAPLRFAG